MNQAQTATKPTTAAEGTEPQSSVVAVYPDHESAERAVRLLHAQGFAMKDLSIVGRDFQTSEEPVGFVSTSDYVKAGAGTGAWVGGLFGLLFGAAFLILPGLGPVIIAGPLSAAILGGIEGAIAGAAIGRAQRRLVGWGIPRQEALKFETQVKAGKFLVVVHGDHSMVERARQMLESGGHDSLNIYFDDATS